MRSPKKPLIFVSHISSEREVAIAFKAQVEKCFLGLFEVFVSSDGETISAGDRWLDRISDALQRCIVEVVICSPESVTRQWINFEAGAGWVRGIPVIPICHSGMNPSQLPIPLNQLQAFSATDPQALNLIFSVLAQSLNSKTPSANFSDFIAAVSAFEKKNSEKDIRKVYDRSADLQHDLPALIAKTAFEILVCGVHFNISLVDRRPDYLRALERGASITVVVLDPESEAVAITAATYGQETDELRAECRQGLSVLKGFHSSYLKAKEKNPSLGPLRFFKFARVPRARFYLFDPTSEDGTVVCTPYIDGLNSSQTPSYSLKAGSSVALPYRDACKELLNQAAEIIF